MKRLTYILIIFTAILSLGLIFSYLPLKVDAIDDLTEEDKEVKLNILTYNKEIYNLAKELLGDNHNIKYIVEDDTSSKDINLERDFKNDILESNLFIYNGFENNDLLKEITKLIDTSKTNLINISRGIRPIINYYDSGEKENPYYLLGVNEYKIALYNIKVSLQEKDINNRNYYEEKYNEISDKIDNSIMKAKNEINNYSNYVIVTNTDKFDYLFRDLDLKVEKIKDKDKTLDFKDKKVIFIHDKSLEEIKNESGLDCNYVQLNSSNDYESLFNNINLIIEGIKSNNNS